MKSKRGLREAMPRTAALIDELREVFGAASIDASIKAGMAGHGDFYAAEAGLEVGSRPRRLEDKTVAMTDVVLGHACAGCRHLVRKLVSPDGHRTQSACRLYRVAAGRCADWAGK